MLTRRRDGYTLIELLTVIAIIGVLASLIFPVASIAKRRARQAQCMNNMYQIFTALKQFQLDEHRYPDFIAGPVQWNTGTEQAPVIVYTDTAAGTIIPLQNNTGMMGGSNGGNGRLVALYPEYITNLSTLRCPFTDLNGDNNRKYTTGATGTGTATDPFVPVPGDIELDPMWDVLNNRLSPAVTDALRAKGPNGDASIAFSVYKCSSYDYQKPPGYLPGDTGQIHYSTVWAKGSDPSVTRQLKWRTPPEDTVVTWCSHHRSNDKPDAQGRSVPLSSSKDICLFLDGHVKQVPSRPMEVPDSSWTNGWQAAP